MALDTLARAMAAHADSKAKTAYQYAVEGGYTGTEEQFTEDMGNLGINADAVNNAVRFDISQSKTDAQKLQAQANLGLDTSDGSLQDQLDNKANIDGNYDTLGAGTADNLTTNLMEQNSVPFNFAPTGGLGEVIEASNRLFLRKIVYGSVVHNQLIVNGDFASTSGWSALAGSVSASNNKGTLTLSSDNTSGGIYRPTAKEAVSGHKYFISATITSATATTARLRCYGTYATADTTIPANTRTQLVNLFTPSGTENKIYVYVNRSGELASGATVVIENVMLIDLSLWYGFAYTVNHIYDMEQANAGAGVSFFLEQCPQASGYIPYNTGTLCSSKPSFHKTVGIQQWDGVYETGYIDTTTGQNTGSSYNRSKNYIRVFPNTEYRMTVSARVFYYGIDNTYLGFDSLGNNADFTTPVNCYYIRFCGTSTSTDIKDEFVFIHWDGTMDGSPTEDYNEHSYPIDDTIDGHGIFKFETVGGTLTDKLFVDGDELTPDGTFTTRYKCVDLGTLDYTLASGAFYSTGLSPAATWNSCMCTKYIQNNSPTASNIASDDKFVAINKNSSGNTYTGNYPSGALIIKDSEYSDKDTFKAAMSGVYLIYEMSTTSTSQKDPYTEEQACDNWGTEIFNDAEYDAGNRSVEVPVGNVIDYPINLKDKLEASPNLPSEDGSYLLTKNGSGYTYTKFASSLPSIPSEDGTYTLKTTVSSGEATLSWVADT